MKKKQCTVCNQILNESDFYQKYPKDKKTHSYCKGCFNDYCKRRWTDRKQQALELKGGKCQVCGYSKCAAALEFHHLDPTQKEFAWVKMRLRSWDAILEELKKCILVCANCHREIHYKD